MTYKFRHREQVKEIMEMDINNKEKMELLAKLETTTTDIARVILTHDLLDIEEGQVVTGLGLHWADRNDENIANMGYSATEQMGDTEYRFYAENVKGYKLQYFDIDSMFEDFYYEQDMEEDGAEDLAIEIAEDEVYQDLLSVVGTEGSAQDECEILISNNKKFEIVKISDERDEVGQITVELKEVK